VSDIRRCLAGLAASYDSLWVDEAEGINDDLAFDGLNGVNDDGDRPRVQRLKGLEADINKGSCGRKWHVPAAY
jgi:hypothetical protein